MTFAEKLRGLRKQAGYSQEQLAEKLNVSRQAVTKWEAEGGIPDIENLTAISVLFDITLDELLSKEKGQTGEKEYLFESVTEYDIAEPKRYDMKLGGACRVVINGYDGEKLRIRLASDTLASLQNDFKVKIDDVKKRIDVDILRKNGMTEATAKKAVAIFVSLPSPYLGKIEAAFSAERAEILSLECDSIELDAKTSRLLLDGVCGRVEINCNSDMEILCKTLCGEVEINQISATSRITVPKDTPFSVRSRGIGTSISFQREGKPVEPFFSREADNTIELNGMKSELIIAE